MERLCEIDIRENDSRSYSQVVTQGKKTNESKKTAMEINDDDTYVTSNRSQKSPDSADTLTEKSETTAQEKLQLQVEDL